MINLSLMPSEIELVIDALQHHWYEVDTQEEKDACETIATYLERLQS